MPSPAVIVGLSTETSGMAHTRGDLSSDICLTAGKARLESLVEGIVEKVGGQDLEEGDEAGPRMLEVRLSHS